MNRGTGWVVIVATMAVAAAGGWIAHRAGESGTAPAAAGTARPKPRATGIRERQAREALFAELQPVKLLNCDLARYGETHDGGYLVCKNLLGDVRSAYSYGISGYDGWGCAISTELSVPVHQYDCFNTTRPSCPGGRPVFHPECIAGARSTDAEGRLFDSLQSQFDKNGDARKHVIVKMDVEGAEWQSIEKTPDEVLNRIDQLIFEFHGFDRDSTLYFTVIAKLKRLFEVAHLHFNNHACVSGGAPFPAWAYEVTFVNKRLAKPDPSRSKVPLPNPLDAPNNPRSADCQTLPLSH